MLKRTVVVQIDTNDALFQLKRQFKGGLLYDKNTQWIIVSRAGDVTESEELPEYLSNDSSVTLVNVPEDYTIAQCYNSVFDKIAGDYVCFTNQYVMYDRSFFSAFDHTLKLHSSANLITMNYKKLNPAKPRIPRIGALKISEQDMNNCKKLLSFLPSVFIRTDFIGDLRFNDVCEEESATMFLLSLWCKEAKSVVVDNVFCYYNSEFLSLKSDRYYGCDNKDFYINSLKNNYLKMIHSFVDNGKDVPVWLYRISYYRLYFKYYANYNVRHRFLLNDEEIEEFLALSKELLQYIPDELILNNIDFEQYAPPFSLRNTFIYIKHDGNLSELNRRFELEDDMLYFYQCGCKYNLSLHKNLVVRAFNFRNGNFSIDLRYFTNLLYEFSPEAISAYLNGKEYPCVKNNIYSLDKVFGLSIEKGYTFSVDFPLLEVLKADSEISFKLKLNGSECTLPLIFSRSASKLNTNCPHSYWKISDEYALVCEDDKLKVKAFKPDQLKRREKLYVREAVHVLNKNKTLDRSIRKTNIATLKALRKEYFKRKAEFEGRRIWLFFDKLYKAGDNGEYAFRHAVTRNDGIECYYIINEDSLDYDRLKAEFPDNILLYNTLECQLYSLMAENIIATHPDIIEFCSINARLATVVKDLFNPNLVCIAHGITIQKNADYQNRLYDNTMFYTTSSKYEVNHILQDVYGYREDEVALTGLARFDGLKNNDQKQILITPTWRRNLVGTAQRNSTREYADSFKKTSYYKIYNSLINDERIIEVAKRTGYKIIFLLHPAMSAQIDDYDRNDYVELIQASGDLNYEKILTESSLMVTDYSGIHYDFGYMRKPIIYYQPKEVPMRFEEGGMKFATMGFGPLCSEYEEAVKLICEYMENQCIMPDEFRKRADDFFAFDDYNSSERIYDAVLKWTNDKMNAKTI